MIDSKRDGVEFLSVVLVVIVDYGVLGISERWYCIESCLYVGVWFNNGFYYYV